MRPVEGGLRDCESMYEDGKSRVGCRWFEQVDGNVQQTGPNNELNSKQLEN